MNFKSLFSIEIINGQVKVSPSEKLLSMSREEQIATLERQLKMYQAELQTINNPTDRQVISEETPDKSGDSDECETELIVVILKNILKTFREANWERINP